jgi:endonuclease/exonuclease/phosphatase family metal-dependent hydrolase
MGQGWSAVSGLRAPYGTRLLDAGVLSECAATDVLCVQELLSREAQQFFDGVGQDRFTSRFRDDNRMRFGARPTMRGSGLGIGARSALTKTAMRSFPSSTVGWDRLARKGALYAQLSVSAAAMVDLITVHLQAGRDPDAAAVRAIQLAELEAFIAAVGSPDRPFIVCGDFNICGLTQTREEAPYRNLTRALAGFVDLGAAADLPTYDPHPERNALAYALDPRAIVQRLDYIFLRPARDAGLLRCTRLEVIFDKPLAKPASNHGTAAWASDHYGLSATFE